MSRSILFCIALCALTAGPAAAQNARPDLALVPADGFFFLQVRPAALWNGELGTKLRKDFPVPAEEGRRELTPMFGVSPDTVETAVFVAATVESMSYVIGGRQIRSKTYEKKYYDKKDFDFKDSPKSDDFKDKRKFEDKPREIRKESPVVFQDGRKDFVPKDAKNKDFDFKDEKRPFPGRDIDWKSKGENLMSAAGMKVITTVKPFDRRKLGDTFLRGEIVERTVKGKTYYVSSETYPWALHFVDDRTFVLASPPAFMEKVLGNAGKAQPKGALTPALELAGKDHHVVVGFNYNEPSAQQMKKELAREFRRPYSSEPVWAFIPLLEVTGAFFALDLAKDTKLQATLSFTNADRAGKAVEAVEDAGHMIRLMLLGRMRNRAQADIEDIDDPASVLFLTQVIKQLETGIRRAKIEQKDSVIEVVAQTKLDVDALKAQAKAEAGALAGDDTARIARQRRVSQNNLKQIVIALHNHHDVYKFFPAAAICSKDNGNPLLSWRVAILPFIEQDALFRQFKLDEPWDSPHNIKLLPMMPKTYAPVGVKTKEPHTTFYQALVGPQAAFETRLDKNFLFGARGIRLFDATDGTSNTIGVVEAFEPVPWTKPAELPYDAQKPSPKIGGGQFTDGFHAAFLDGVVRFLSKRIDEATLRALITRNGGEVIDLEKFERP